MLKLAKGEALAGKVSVRPGGGGSGEAGSSGGSGGSSSSARDVLVDVEIELQGTAARQVYVVQEGPY